MHLRLTLIIGVFFIFLMGCASDRALIKQVMEGNYQAALNSISKGAAVNTIDSNGFTPLHWACIKSHKEIAELLISKGANINAKNNEDETPLHLAASKENKEIVVLLISKGADINAMTKYSFTPLHCACSNGHKEIVELLIQKGANVNARASDDKAYTPLMVTVSDRTDITEILKTHGAKMW